MSNSEITNMLADSELKHKLQDGLQPTQVDINKWARELLSICTAIPNTLNPRLGYTSVIQSQADYALHVQGVANPPAYAAITHPGIEPVIPHGALVAERSRLISRHELETQIWRTSELVAKKCKELLLMRARPFLGALHSRRAEYDHVTLIQMLHHLRDTYGRPTRDLLKLNSDKIDTVQYDPNTTLMEPFLDLASDVQEFTVGSDEPILDLRLINMVLRNVKLSNFLAFNTATQNWDAKPRIERTWANFRSHMLAAHAAFRTSNEYTGNQSTGQQGYHSANSATIGNLPIRMYCFTHGSQFTHDGHHCTVPNHNHKAHATADNMLGGHNNMAYDRQSPESIQATAALRNRRNNNRRNRNGNGQNNGNGNQNNGNQENGNQNNGQNNGNGNQNGPHQG